MPTATKPAKQAPRKVGDRVTVFHDPYTQLRSEGEAILVRCLINDPEMSHWRVRFLSDGQTVERWIAPPV
jgi:hypothetical protein